jgi:hypothetical protein
MEEPNRSNERETNSELTLYSVTNITGIIKRRRIRKAGHGVCMAENKNIEMHTKFSSEMEPLGICIYRRKQY